MLFVHMLWCNAIISIICLIVCIATNSGEVTGILKTKLVPGNLESKARCALDHFSLPNNIPVNHDDMLRLI
jgi:hypothetical protein